MKKVSMLLVAVAMFLGITSSAHAALYLRGTDSMDNQLIYDDDLDITWYDYSHIYDKWQDQMNWADTLDVELNGVTYSDWRLPVSDDTCLGFDCTKSEMGHLYYTELKNSFDYGDVEQLKTSFIDGYTNNQVSFLHLQPDGYWSDNEYAPRPDFAWVFSFGTGRQNHGSKVGVNYALAVRDGDVAAVPEPATMLLFGAGLAGLGIMRKRMKG